MRILHITPHLGGGVGAVLLSWLEKVKDHTVICLDQISEMQSMKMAGIPHCAGMAIWPSLIHEGIRDIADIVVVHYWDHPMLYDFLKQKLPPCRLVFWCHKNFEVPKAHLSYPDLFIDVSPVQGHGRHIWSVRNMEEFFKIEPQSHPGFNIGYVGTVDYKKIHPNFIQMSEGLKIPNKKIIVCGEVKIPLPAWCGPMTDMFFVGQTDDIKTHLSYMDVFGYPLRPDHYGTCEQALGEAMAAGVVPVCMNNPAERYIIDHGIDGFLAKDEHDYAIFIKILYDYPEMRKRMATAAREKAIVKYCIHCMVDQWNDLFEEMMEQPKKEREAL